MAEAGGGIASAALLLAVVAAWGCGAAVELPEQSAPRLPVEVETAVDRAVATTGDLITYRITVDHDPSLEVEIPEPGSEIAGFRIVDVGSEEPREEGGRRVLERWYELRADLVGSYVLPAVEVAYREADAALEAPFETVAASEIFVEVESVLPEDGEVSDIRDIKPLHEIEAGWPWRWLALAALVLTLAAAGLWLAWRRRRPETAPLVPPHEAAFLALEELRALDLSDPRSVRRFYFGLSEVVRAYVEGRFGLNATDLTSEEIRARLSEVPGLAAGQRAGLEGFLDETDRVKFAHHEPQPSEIEAVWEQALGFVEQTRPREVEAPEEELRREAA